MERIAAVYVYSAKMWGKVLVDTYSGGGGTSDCLRDAIAGRRRDDTEGTYHVYDSVRL